MTAKAVAMLIGVDVGTSASKAIIANIHGKRIAEHVVEHGLLTPKPLHAEQHAQVWLGSLVTAVSGAMSKANVSPADVLGLTISSLYGGSGVPVDANLDPVRPCLIWMDRRALQQCDFVGATIGEDRLFDVTGNGIDPYYGFSKMLWIKNSEPELFKKIRYFLPPNAWFIAKLTGAVACDLNSAGNIGGVFDIRSQVWAKPLIEDLGLEYSHFPERLVQSFEIVGKLHAQGARSLGLLEGTPVIAGGIDAALATLSAGMTSEGQHTAMIGTSMCWGYLHRQTELPRGLISMPYVLDGLTYSHGGSGTAGAVVRWFRDTVSSAALIAAPGAHDQLAGDLYGRLAEAATSIKPGCDGLTILPYFAGERSPIWDGNARGTMTGMTLGHTNAHIYRALLESVSFALRQTQEYLGEGLAKLEAGLPVVGGAAQSPLWLQIIADVTGRQVTASASAGEAAFGGAALAALGLGIVDRNSLGDWITSDRHDDVFEPVAANKAAYDKAYRRYTALYRALKPYFSEQNAA